MNEPSVSPAPILQAEGIEKSFRWGRGRLHVLKGTGLALPPGEVCALMGSSGSGKSTLLHLLGLLDRPDRGIIRIEDRPVQALGQFARAKIRSRKIGFVFQQFHLLPELTALENVLMPRRLALGWQWWSRRGREKLQARAVLDSVGLSGRLTHRPAQLSGGEQQRVALARALVGGPALLLADEPTGNLDRKTGGEVLDLMLELARRQDTAVLLATHDPDVASHCRRILCLEDGKLKDGQAGAES
ncbi:MAG: ABC transporter ATP-binding protein [Planctomycetota bacterium]